MFKYTLVSIKSSKLTVLDLLFYILLILCFFIRVINLNYNTAFNDEGIYIVIGKMGLFAGDWWSYGANQWMAGLPYIYPPISALSYQIGGLTGSRFFSVLIGTLLVEEIYRFTKLLNLFDKKTNQLTGVCAVFLSGFAGVGIFLSKFATYDILSYFLFIFSINSFLKSGNYNNGKYYFLSALTLIASLLTKITTGFYFPISVFVSLIITKKRSSNQQKLALYYFYIPLLIGALLTLLFPFRNFLSYILSQKGIGNPESIK